jgi:hypothetical protein
LGKNFATALQDLNTEGSVDSTLGGGQKSGFSFASTGAASTSTTPSTFFSKADPLSTGTFGTGNRHFYSNETFVIYQNPDATIADPGASRIPTGTGISALQ